MAQPNNIQWSEGLDATIARARQEGRTVLVDMTAAPM